MPAKRLPKAAKLRLLVLLAAGGTIGALAAATRNTAVQLDLVSVAAALGIYAGLMIRRARQLPG